jgi:hypothetical protein
MGAMVSELLADALARRRRPLPLPKLHWTSKPMNAMVNLEDKEEVYAALEGGNE